MEECSLPRTAVWEMKRSATRDSSNPMAGSSKASPIQWMEQLQPSLPPQLLQHHGGLLHVAPSSFCTTRKFPADFPAQYTPTSCPVDSQKKRTSNNHPKTTKTIGALSGLPWYYPQLISNWTPWNSVVLRPWGLCVDNFQGLPGRQHLN